MKGLTPADLSDSQKTALIFQSSLIGGTASLIAGGNFIRGALTGCNIAMFNYTEEFPAEAYVDENGKEYTELPDHIVVGTASVPNTSLDYNVLYGLVINGASYINTGADSFGESLKEHGGNSTLGVNKLNDAKKVYWKTSAQRPFYGNKYVSTQMLTAIGSKVVGRTTWIGYGIGLAQVGLGLYQDMRVRSNNEQTNYYNTVRAVVSFGAAYAGMEAFIGEVQSALSSEVLVRFPVVSSVQPLMALSGRIVVEKSVA